MGGPNWYPLVVSEGNPICSFRQFLAKTYRFASIQNVTDRRQTDRRHPVAKARPIVRSAKNRSLFGEVMDTSLVSCFLDHGVYISLLQIYCSVCLPKIVKINWHVKVTNEDKVGLFYWNTVYSNLTLNCWFALRKKCRHSVPYIWGLVQLIRVVICLHAVLLVQCLLSLYHNCESTTIRRYHDAFDISTTTEVIEITICVRFDCDTTTTKNWR